MMLIDTTHCPRAVEQKPVIRIMLLFVNVKCLGACIFDCVYVNGFDGKVNRLEFIILSKD